MKSGTNRFITKKQTPRKLIRVGNGEFIGTHVLIPYSLYGHHYIVAVYRWVSRNLIRYHRGDTIERCSTYKGCEACRKTIDSWGK